MGNRDVMGQLLGREYQGVRRLMDKEFMRSRRGEVRGRHDHRVERRIRERELWEIEREKRLILEGKMGLEEAPYIADHPVFVVSKMTHSILEEKKMKVAEHLKPKGCRSPDYELMKSAEAEGDDESFMEMDQEELERARILWEMEKSFENGECFSPEEYEKTKYENPLVTKLRTLESVSEMYDLAEEILGPVVHHHQRKKTKG